MRHTCNAELFALRLVLMNVVDVLTRCSWDASSTPVKIIEMINIYYKRKSKYGFFNHKNRYFTEHIA